MALSSPPCLSPSSSFHFLPALHLPNELMRFRRAHIAIEFRPPHCHHFQPESPPTTPLVGAPPFRTLLHCNFTNLYDSVYASCPIGTSTNLASNLFVPFCTRSNNVAPLMVICCCCCSVCSTPLQVCSLFTTLYRLVFAAPPRRRRNLALRRARGLAPSPLLRAAPLVMHGGRSAPTAVVVVLCAA